MKRFHITLLTATVIFTLISVPAFSEIPIPFFGGSNFSLDADTIFSADLNDGSTGLQTVVGFGLWFEFAPYQDRNVTPRRDAISVSLKLANSAFYAWRGYDNPDDSGHLAPTLWGNPDQATSIWFDTFIAQLEYNQYFLRIAGIEPEITFSQASIKSVFDPAIRSRTDVDHNRLPLPLFHSGSLYNGAGGVVSVIGQDLVNLNRREVQIAGNLSGGMKTEIFDLTFKIGSWYTGSNNIANAWVMGLDFIWRPDFSNLISLALMGGMNYDTVTPSVNDPMADRNALKESPFGFGAGYEYRIALPGSRMVLKPYAGVDFIYETESEAYNYEIGAGIQWFFRGTGAATKRDHRIGGISLSASELPAALIAGFNVDGNGIVNGIISLNESPHLSLIPRLGGFLNLELMNIGAQEYSAPNGAVYNDFLWALMAQIEYLLTDKIMPYAFARYLPGLQAVVPGYKNDPDPPATVFGKDYITLTTKFGCQLTFIKYFLIDIWYERNDIKNNNEWTIDNGLLNINFRISL